VNGFWGGTREEQPAQFLTVFASETASAVAPPEQSAWHKPCSACLSVPRPFSAASSGRGSDAPASSAGAAALERSDIAAINEWLSVTRLRSATSIAVAVPVISLLGNLDLPWPGLVLVCAAVAALSPVYRRWTERGWDPGQLVYAQLVLDTLAITAGLGTLGPNRLLFCYVYLMTIVPATMVSGACGIVITALSTVCYGVILSMSDPSALVHASAWARFLVPVFLFSLIANQSFFYKCHLRDKNRDLAVAGAGLEEVNAQLKITAETASGLLDVSHALNTSLDIGVVIERLHRVAVECLRTDWCATILVDSRAPNGYRLIASRGLGATPNLLGGRGWWEFGALVAAEGLLEVSDATRGPAAGALQEWKIASGVFVAMRCSNRTVGLFGAGYRSRTGTFNSFQHKLADGIATQAAVAIQNATLHAAQREEAEISTALLEVAGLLNTSLDAEDRLDRLTAITRKLIGCDFAHVVLCDHERGTMRFTAGTDIRGPQLVQEVRQIEFDLRDFAIIEEAGRKGAAERYEGATDDLFPARLWKRWSIRSLLLVPLYLRSEMIGVLAVGSHEDAKRFTSKTKRLLTGIAYQTVTAIENGRLVSNLRAANTLKSEFIGTMSHELRTPLNAIMGYSELLRDGDFGPVSDDQREICAKLLDYSRQLLDLIQATLDVNRMEAGALPVTLAPLRIGTLLDELAAQMPASWAKPSVRVSFAADPDLPEIRSDYAKLKMVVRNLLHNAIKFTDSGTVAVRAYLENDGAALTIEVADSGVGITPENQAIIFDMFRQVDGSDRRRHDGVGLGLYIVQRLTATLGGTVGVESEVGRGSCFRLRFPLSGVTDERGAPMTRALSA
jgi:signal transduction histidine kinase